jgi:hypothetical protein
MKTDSLAILSAHVVKTLPDHISDRRELLCALRHVMGPDHPARKTVNNYITAIDAIEQQLQPLLISEMQQHLALK